MEDTVEVQYRTFPIDFEKKYYTIDTSLIYKNIGIQKDFLFHNNTTTNNFFSDASIKKSGSISRGITFGSAQELSVNSTLNLQLDGRISNNMRLLATLTDKNLPIQPEGNTSQLQDFDQVFVQLYGDNYKIIGGDFWLKKPEGYFLNYNKKVQGLYGQYAWGKQDKRWSARVAGALSKGKFARNIIQGIEGNQGPYRLRGNEDEPYIVVLSGTEKVYLNGELLKRGQELDYIIDYNTSELTFTARHMIDKDSRIVVEFQYTDQSYARSLIIGDVNYKAKKFSFWLNYYTEQDAKHQTLQQALTNKDKLLLSEIGDSLNKARISSIDSTGYTDNQVTYKMIDSLGNDSVLVHSINKDSAIYKVFFTEVAQGSGNYVFEKFTANGRVYKWVAPISGVSQGNYEPFRIMVTPKRKAMITAGAKYIFNKKWYLQTELSTSNSDLNTYSPNDDKNNRGLANRTELGGFFHLGKDSLSPWSIQTKLNVEYNSSNFQAIERFRSVEFNRDWNVRNQNYKGFQLLGNLSGKLQNEKYGFVQLEAQNYTFGNDYQGDRAQLLASWNQNGFGLKVDGSYLNSIGIDKNTYIRHIATVSQKIGPIKIGFSDNHELNKFKDGDTILRTNSYQWYEWQTFIASADSNQNNFKVFYKERYDWRSDSIKLVNAAKARSIGANFEWLTNKYSNLSATVSYRSLKIQNSKLIDQSPENTFLGSLDYRLKLWHRALISSTFYQIGSGLERKKEFLYIEVNNGQGIYTWIDYNQDGVKDLNEFELAKYPDQANYIRVFTPSDDYVRTYSTEFNQTLFWQAEKIWGQKKGFLKFLSRISDQARFRVAKKLSNSTLDLYNPFSNRNIDDSILVSYASTIRNTLFFNRTNPVIGGNYVYEQTGSKILLSNGFDGRESRRHQVTVRWNLIKKITVKVSIEKGNKNAKIDYTDGRNYAIVFQQIKPEFIYQPNSRFRLSLISRYEEKRNKEDLGGELAYIGDFGLEMKWNQLQSGSFTAHFNFVSIHFHGNIFNSISYEMLESLKPGKNFTWGLQFQYNLSKYLQINVLYNGRKSEQEKMIHSAGVEVRAFF